MRNVIWLTVLALFIAGCSSTRPVQKAEPVELRKIGIVSLIGEEFHFTKVGLTLFNNDEFSRDISSWQLDSIAEQSARDALREIDPPAQAVILPVNHALVAKLYRQNGELGSYVDLHRIDADLKALVAKNPVDSLIVIHGEQVQDPIRGTCVYLYGAGLYYRSLPFTTPFVKPHSFLRVVVLDGKTLKPLSQKLVKCISKDYGKTQLSWEDDIRGNLTGKQWSRLQTEIKNLIRTNISAALEDIGL